VLRPLEEYPTQLSHLGHDLPLTCRYTQCINIVQASRMFAELPEEAAKHC